MVRNVAKMPFADVRRLVSLALEVFGDGDLFAWHTGPALDGSGVSGNTGAKWVAAGE